MHASLLRYKFIRYEMKALTAYFLIYPVGSDGHDKPFCTKAITIIDNLKKTLGNIDKSQFLKAISVIDKLSPINFSDKCCGKFSMCLTKFFLRSDCHTHPSKFFFL